MVICLALPAITPIGTDPENVQSKQHPGKLWNTVRNRARPLDAAMTYPQKKMLMWMLISMIAALVAYTTFRGYLNADLLLGFANTFSC